MANNGLISLEHCRGAPYSQETYFSPSKYHRSTLAQSAGTTNNTTTTTNTPTE